MKQLYYAAVFAVDMRTDEKIAEVFGKLVSIDSPSLKEREMADHLKKLFGDIGVNLEEDNTQEVTGSNAGNLFGKVEGTVDSESLLLGVHMDTVEPSRGKKAIFHPDGTVTSDGTTVLGADDLAGVTAIYEAVRYLNEQNIPHRTIEILITTGEELYCKGANAFDYSKIQSKEAYALDLSGKIGAAAYAAPTLISFEAAVQGKAAHAGFYPEKGINSIQAAARAIARLSQGRIDENTTANIGLFSGGTGTNIVPETCTAGGEIRSLNHEKAMKILNEYHQVFQEEADKVGAVLKWEEKLNIIAYETSLGGKIAENYRRAVEKAGLTPEFEKTFGGSDNNVFAQHGIHGLVIATSMNQVHSCSEYCSIPEIRQVSEILVNLCEM